MSELKKLNEDIQVAVIGMGYVGLTLAVVMAEKGFIVHGLEIDEKKISYLKSGSAHFYEKNLSARLFRALKRGNLKFHRKLTDIKSLEEVHTFIITVGTPLDSFGKPRMDMVENVSREVSSVMNDDSIVILRSTVKLGTSRNIVLPILKNSGKSFGLAYCPERTLEGKALEELVALPQIIGGLCDKDVWRATNIFNRITPTIVRVSNLESAELIKLLDNSYRDMNFAFGNEVALMCESAGLNGVDIIRAANMGYDRTNIAQPGFVGGPCLQKDPHILQNSLSQFQFVPELIKQGRKTNESLFRYVIDRSIALVPELKQKRNSKIGVCGLAFKGRPETDDTRGSPSLDLVKELERVFPSANIICQDFALSDHSILELGLKPASLDSAFKDADLVIIANNNEKYGSIDITSLLASMNRPALLFDVWSSVTFDEIIFEGRRIARLGSSTMGLKTI